MFVRIFIIAVIAALFGTCVSYAYTTVYAKILTMDFSEGASFLRLFAYNIMFCIGTGILYGVLSKAIKKDKWASFITNFAASLAAVALVFYQLTLPDPTFKNESVMGMESFFNTFFIPILFFPALSWMTFKTLISKN
jgi:hypothetical protein